MIIADLSPVELRQRLTNPGLRLRTGPLVANIVSAETAIADGIARQYADHRLADEDGFADFHVTVARPLSLRRWWRPQAFFIVDGQSLFNPLPADQAFPLLEWGLNWCISTHCQQYLLIHAAVVELHGGALILPAPPGSGKSTLCAALVQRGWRLLSDELAIIDPASGLVIAIPRPVSLKNESIDVIRDFAPEAVLNPPVFETVKGTVSHMKPPAASVLAADQPARPAWVVLPRYEAGSATTLAPLGKAETLMRLAENSFNYNIHGRRGFETLRTLVDRAGCFSFRYSQLEEAVSCFCRLAENREAAP